MAKKKETLTPEECLQAALVPESEQPYRVPGNWCWTRMENIAQWGSGGTPSRKIPEYYNGDIPWIKTGELNDDYIFETEEHITQEAISHSSAKLFPANTVAIAMYGATIGKVGIMGIAATTNQACACGVSNPSTNYKYLFYYARSQKENFIKKGKGGAQPNISQEIIKSHEFPLPPLSEQQRIVDRIESLFAKLDEAKQKAQDALDSFETRKAAILHKAFTGELTAQWRKEHGVGIESWEKANLGKYVDSQYGYTESASQEQVGPKFLRITDIQDGVVNWANVPFCKISDTDFERYAVSQNDIMIARTGATTGKSYLIVDDVTAVFASYLIRIKIKSPKLQPQYLYGFMQSQMYWGQITEFSAGIAQPGVNAKKLKEIILPIPSVPEQVEIVRIIDALLAKEQQAKEAAEGVLEQIDLIKKSILARAFRGELGTNDPSEESAVELLKRVLAVEPPPKTRAKGVSIPRKVEEQLKSELERKIIKSYYYSDSQSLPIDTLMGVSSKKFALLESIRNLEQRGIIKKLPNGNYKLVR